jgi:hypothetical protein
MEDVSEIYENQWGSQCDPIEKESSIRCLLLSVKMCHGVRGCLGPGQGAERVKKGYQKSLAIVPLIFSVSDLNPRRDFGLNPDPCKTN